jgi:hypothetical protein
MQTSSTANRRALSCRSRSSARGSARGTARHSQDTRISQSESAVPLQLGAQRGTAQNERIAGVSHRVSAAACHMYMCSAQGAPGERIRSHHGVRAEWGGGGAASAECISAGCLSNDDSRRMQLPHSAALMSDSLTLECLFHQLLSSPLLLSAPSRHVFWAPSSVLPHGECVRARSADAEARGVAQRQHPRIRHGVSARRRADRRVHTCDSLLESLTLPPTLVAIVLSHLQHEVFAAQGERFRFVSPGTTFILMHEDGLSNTTLRAVATAFLSSAPLSRMSSLVI